jgi:hypothetical protein
MKYEDMLYIKYMAADSRTYEDFIGSLEGVLQMVKDMKADGVDADFDHVDDGFVQFLTDDKELAQKYGMREIDVDESDCDDEYDDPDRV